LLCGGVAVAVAAVNGTVHVVPGTGYLRSFACPSRGSCIAAGAISKGGLLGGGVVVPVSGGKPGAAEAVRGSVVFGSVACPSPKHCLAVGGTNTAGAVVPITGGRPGKLVTVQGTGDVYGVSCGSASSCWATAINSQSTQAELVHIVNGAVAKVDGLKGSNPFMFSGSEGGAPSPFCTSATSCLAVGTGGQSNGPGLVLTLANGKISASHTVSGVEHFYGLGCASASYCIAVGAGAKGAVEVPVVNGKPGTVHPASGATYLNAVACRSTTKCYAFGQGSTKGVVVPINDGKPGQAQAVSFIGSGAWCGASGCVAVGYLPRSSGPEGVVYPFS
jgi:hypothetical protein